MMEVLAGVILLLVVAPLLILGAVGFLLLVAPILPTAPRRVRETFHCPWTRRVVTADFLVPEGAEHPAEVASCTAFPDPGRVACKKACRELAEVRWGPSRGVFPRWALTAGGLVTWRDPAALAPGK